MSSTPLNVGDGSVGVVPDLDLWRLPRTDWARLAWGSLILLGIVGGAYALHSATGYGAQASLSLLIGTALGVVFERGRFCFFCILRDWLEDGDSTGVYAILAALALGGVGYALVFGAFLPNPNTGRLPPDAHIGPLSWVLLAAGLAFGLGMALSGACISGHLYRLGQGSSRAPFALLGTLVGFGLGFLSWQRLYIDTLISAPVPWLPASLGYGGALALHLAVLSALALLLLRALPPAAPRAGGRLTLAVVYDRVFRQRWNPLVTGALVAALGTVAYFRLEPLGVTSQLGSFSRTFMSNQGWLAERLNGLDGFAGCATVVAQTITDNGWLILGLVLGSWAMSQMSKRFVWSALTVRGAVSAVLGGVALGWAAMVALGCTVGTLLSGISAFALSGWAFGLAVVGGVALGVRLGLHRLA
ncbi:MAG: YeeE/YedE family protein [Anaerolineae bacterium]|nr:YeeE/YedE family protein [Anaerolineae bacterium]MDW8173382.1 YeeE/YedE family protein [Anaerolineae bacterium]